MKRGPAPPRYCLDADALIYVHHYFPRSIRTVSKLAREGTIVVPEGVFRELCQKTDKLEATVRKWKAEKCGIVDIDDARLRTELARIER